MSTGHILLLVLIAGATIFLGLPIARISSFSPVARAGLSALATGILLFLLWDVLTHAVEPIDSALGTALVSWGSAIGHSPVSEVWFAKSQLPAH